jgi:periplasmic divalent cation tolerance protein
MSRSKYCIITTTTNSKRVAKSISKKLLQDGLVACAQHYTIDSEYMWKGELVEDRELVLQLKTKKSLFDRVEECIKSLHNYKVPQITMVSIKRASDDYLDWIDSSTI